MMFFIINISKREKIIVNNTYKTLEINVHKIMGWFKNENILQETQVDMVYIEKSIIKAM